MSYSIYDYGRMIADRARMEAYTAALQRAVGPDSVVLDLGAGTGIFSLLACQLGARRVYAIEPNPALQLARELARENGCVDRITFYQELSTRVNLPEKADVIISDLRGVLPLYDRHIEAIVDARSRLLAPGGVLIPRLDRLWVAVASAEAIYQKLTAPWESNTFDLDPKSARRYLTNTWHREPLRPEQVILEPRCWWTLDYATVERPNAEGEVHWIAESPASAHGLALWFESELADGIGFSTAPGFPETVYGSGFFPWSEPVSIEPGDRIEVQLGAHLVGSDYVWQWETRISENSAGPRKAHFRQSSFFGQPLSAEALKKREAGFVPRLDGQGRAVREILSCMDGRRSLREIADAVYARFPAEFKTPGEALELVRGLSDSFSQ